MVRRRQFLGLVGATGIGHASLAGASESASGSGEQPRGHDATSIREHGRFRYEWSERRFVYEYTYEVPESVTELTITSPYLDDFERTSVLATEHLKQDPDDPTLLHWDGEGPPRFKIDHGVDDTPLTEAPLGWSTDSGAMTPSLRNRFSWQPTDDSVTVEKSKTFDGEGYAGATLIYAGPHETTTATVDGTTLRVVVVDDLVGTADVEEVMDVLAFGERHLDRARLSYDHVTTFVVPARRLTENGWTFFSTIVVDPQAMTVDAVDNTPAHEYGHVLFGTFGTGKMYWLTEGAAEYYGNLVSLNAGVGTFESFLESVSTTLYADAVLTNTETEAPIDYRKGPHVLAALDAEIQRRTGGDRTLLDVLATPPHKPPDLSTYDGFVTTVVEVTGDESMADWVDRYVDSREAPTIPEKPRFFELPGTELAATSTPSATPAGSTTPGSTPTGSTTGPSDTADTSTARETGTSTGTAAGFGVAATLGGLGGLAAYLLGSDRDEES